MATLLKLKIDLEDERGVRMKMVFAGATEAHLLAQDIGVYLALISMNLSIETLILRTI